MRSPLKRPRVIGFLLGALPLLVAALRAADCNGNGIPDDRDLKAAQLVFSAPLTFPTGFSPWAVVAVDLEGDGDPDLVTANTYSTYGSDRTLSVLLNDGWGNFGPATVLNVGAVPKTVAITDLDSDGQPDLISANYFSRDLSILLNRGGDKFTEAVNLPLEGRPLWVVTGDFDGDQRSDLAVALEKSSQVRILLHRRDGTFEAGAGAELGAAPTAILDGDFDGDGDPDLAAVSRSSDTLAVALNAGDGSFGPAQSFTLPTPSALASGDFDLDGDIDLAAASATVANVWLFRNDGQKAFEAPLGFPSRDKAFSLVAGDFDGDGIEDLALTSPASWVGTMLLADGKGGFTAGTDVPVNGPAYAAPSDLDGDGDVDLAVTHGWLGLLFNNSGGSFVRGFTFTESAPDSVQADDLDGDARADLAMVNRRTGGASVLLSSERQGGLGPVRNYPGDFGRFNFEFGSRMRSFLLALDFDGDGDTDLCSQGSGLLAAFLNEGKGIFGQPTTVTGTLGAIFATAADLDGDGNLDLVTIVQGTSAISVAFNSGNGSFFDSVEVPTGGQPTFVIATDLDGDGRNDLAAVDPLSPKEDLSVLLNLGAGTFGSPVSAPIAIDGIFSLAVADMDGDGIAELITGGDSLKNFWVGHDLGKGSFRWVRYPGGTSDRLSVSDLDADGLPELIFLLPGQRKVSILRNRGTGISVNSPVFVTTVDLPSSVAAGDLDGDGDLDLATTEVEGNSLTRGSVSLLLNRTPPPLSRDRDHDGIPDECARAVFHRGDPSGDGGTDLSDAVSLLDFLFTAGPAPGCLESADADNDGQVDLSDPIALLNFLFLAGAPPAPPGPAPLPCGPDPDSQGSPGDRGCRTYVACRA